MSSTKVPQGEHNASLSIDATDTTDEAPSVYCDAAAAEVNITIPPHVCSVDFLAYRIPESMISDDQTTRYVSVAPLANNDGIKSLLKRQMSLPPRPVVRIQGTHIDRLYSWGNIRTDFDLTLDITPLIMPTPHANLTRQTIMSTNGFSDEEAFHHWVERFSAGMEERWAVLRRC